MSRFVAAGKANDDAPEDDEWARAEQRIKDTKQQKADISRQEDGKSLYEVLQANKAAKQEAHEESLKLKNQFRNLDDDEVDFLDSVLESTRAQDANVKKETSEQLDAFRKQQQEANNRARADEENGGPMPDEEQWAVARKRKRKAADIGTLQGLKVRRKSSSAQDAATSAPQYISEDKDDIRTSPDKLQGQYPPQNAPRLTSPDLVSRMERQVANNVDHGPPPMFRLTTSDANTAQPKSPPSTTRTDMNQAPAAQKHPTATAATMPGLVTYDSDDE